MIQPFWRHFELPFWIALTLGLVTEVTYWLYGRSSFPGKSVVICGVPRASYIASTEHVLFRVVIIVEA